VSECRIHVSFRTATVQGLSMRWAKACHGNGPVDVFGVMARNPIAPLEPLPSYTVLPLKQAVPLPENVPLEQGACLGIPGITAHRAVHGAVGACAVQLAHQGGARVIATCRAERDKEIASRAGADEVLLTGENLVQRIRALAPDGVHHVVEVAFGANIESDMELLAEDGSIAAYASNAPRPEIPFWQLVFVNARIFFFGSDDVPADAKTGATRAISQAFEAGWQGFEIAEIVPLDQIARAHELVEHPVKPGRVLVAVAA